MGMYLVAPANKTGTTLFTHDGTVIPPDVTGLYRIDGYQNLASQNPDFRFFDDSVAGPSAWPAPSGPVNFSATIAPSPTADTWNPGAGEQDQLPVYNPPATTEWLTWPVVFSAKLLSISATFGGTFGGTFGEGELVTLQFLPKYANAGPLAPPPIVLRTGITGTQQLTAAQLAQLAANHKNSPLVCLWAQIQSSIANSAVTAEIAIVTE